MSHKNDQKVQPLIEPKDKQYSLTEDETTNIESRQSIIKQYQYLIHVINADIQAYTNFVVCKRLAIPEGVNYSLSQDNKTLTVMEEKDEQHTDKK